MRNEVTNIMSRTVLKGIYNGRFGLMFIVGFILMANAVGISWLHTSLTHACTLVQNIPQSNGLHALFASFSPLPW
jgi:hypothetical protein